MSREKERTRREQIVDVARSLLLSQGYEGTKIGDIADTLGVSKAAVSYYFPTKDTFIDELVEPFVQALEDAVSANTNAASSDGVRSALAAYLEVLLDHVDVARWVDTDVAVQTAHDVGRRIDAASDQLVATITGNRRSTSARIAGYATLGGIWRPVLSLDANELRKHQGELLDAALASLDHTN